MKIGGVITTCALVAACAAGCGPTVTAADGGSADAPPVDASTIDRPDADLRPDPDRASVAGRVFAPNLAPGLAPAGQEMPVSGATVSLRRDRPPAIPDRVYCDSCIPLPAQATTSSHDGSFALANVPPGDYWLVIDKAQFRREQQVTLVAGELRQLAPTETTLPSHHDPEAGLWTPRIAVAAGLYDRLEDVIGKLGLGRIDENGRLVDDDDELDVYGNGGNPRVEIAGSAAQLAADPDRLESYHIVLFPASTPLIGIDDEAVLRNLRRYVSRGGKLYVTGWSGTVADRPFPPQLEFGDAFTDSTGTYDPIGLTGSVGTAGDASGESYECAARVSDPDLALWLETQSAIAPGQTTAQPIDAERVPIVRNANWIKALGRVLRGEDSNGFPAYDQPRTWVVGASPRVDDVERPLVVSFEPTGCGRVLYSTYQTSNLSVLTLTPQERILIYLLLEVGTCSTLPEVE